MKISEAVTTIVCIAVLFILVAVLFVVKDNMDNKNKNQEQEGNKTTIIIRYDMNGGDGSISTSTIEKGSAIVLPTPTREGYRFAGWYVNGKLVDEYTKFDSDTTIVAKWILIGSTSDDTPKPTPTPSQTPVNPNKSTFVVSFDSKGGTKIGSITCNCNNTPLNLPADPDKDGYDFTGWVDKNGKKVGNGSVLKCEDITLYATWKVAEKKEEDPNYGRKYTVYFETGNGISVDPVVLECGKVLLDLRDLGTIEIDDYNKQIFNGWYDENGKKVTNGSTLQCKDQTLHAKWIYSTTRPTPTATPLPEPTMDPIPITW